MKAKRTLVWILTAALVLVLCACSGVAGGTTASAANEDSAKPTAIWAGMQKDGTAYIVTPDGTSVVINDDVQSAVMSPDQTHIVVLLEGGTLYITDPAQSEKQVIDENADSIRAITNEGFLYSHPVSQALSDYKTRKANLASKSTPEMYYRVLFADSNVTELGTDIDYTLASDGISVLWVTDDGDVCAMAAAETEPRRLGTYETDDVDLGAVSNDGQTAIWGVQNDDECTVYIADGDEKETMGKIDLSDTDFHSLNVDFSKDQELAVASDTFGSVLLIKKNGSETITAQLGTVSFMSSVLTQNGRLPLSNARDALPLYVSAATEDSTGANLYSISESGDRERVLSETNSLSILDGHVLYTDMEDALRYAKLGQREVTEETKIASDVQRFKISSNGQYTYYLRGTEDDDTYSLYCYPIGAEEPQKIASEVSSTYYCGTDGKSVYFFQDCERIGKSYKYQGTLMRWSVGSDTPEKIASEVLVSTPSSALNTGELRPDGFTFKRYNELDEENETLDSSIMYYNGTESSKIAEGIINEVYISSYSWD